MVLHQDPVMGVASKYLKKRKGTKCRNLHAEIAHQHSATFPSFVLHSLEQELCLKTVPEVAPRLFTGPGQNPHRSLFG